MSISAEILQAHKGHVDTVYVKKSDLHGEDSVYVKVYLNNGKTVEGNFAKHPRSGFGGVQFSGPKDVVGLMNAKIDAVLRGTAE